MTKQEKKKIEAPMAVWVHGGTSSSAQDKQDAIQHADAERRRAQQSQSYAEAGRNPQAAKMHTLSLGGRDAHAGIVLALKHPKDDTVMDWITCELSSQPEEGGGVELMLVLCCPRCVYKLNRHPDRSQIHIRQSNRMFWLDERTGDQGGQRGELWVNPNDATEVVTLAGTITTKDWCKCPHEGCGWTFRADESVVYTK